MYFLLIGFIDDPLFCFFEPMTWHRNRLAAPGQLGELIYDAPHPSWISGGRFAACQETRTKSTEENGWRVREGIKKEGKDGESSVFRLTSSYVVFSLNL